LVFPEQSFFLHPHLKMLFLKKACVVSRTGSFFFLELAIKIGYTS